LKNSLLEKKSTAEFGSAINDRSDILSKFNSVRSFTEKLCAPLEIEDYVIQSMPDVSPTKWHLGHTSWFFETFILEKVIPDYKPYHPLYNYLFNSYYIQVGERWHRPSRGLLSRPTVKAIFDYRNFINNNTIDLIETCDDKLYNEIAPLIEIGLNHEQQHQELLLTDIKNVLSINPLNPVYSERNINSSSKTAALEWIEFEGGMVEIGSDGSGFNFDNETPVHKEFLYPFRLANRLITNKEFIDFIEDSGYKNATLWLSDGWATVESEGWRAPLYWEIKDGKCWNFTLNGFRQVNPDEPVCHIGQYEADAFAQWRGCRLPSEAEWEVAAGNLPYTGNLVEHDNHHTIPVEKNADGLMQMYGDVWEWTQSAYLPYPGYKPLPGALGEYNGKFMSNQIVLRGGSCATSQTHIRNTYRNFFPPHSRWQFTGLRLAQDIKQ
jgi:ergothioneine biosynthesis protein EgtB